jgi:hypothetical protein
LSPTDDIGTDSDPFIDLVPDQEPEATQVVAFEEVHVKSTELPIFTDDSPDTKLFMTAARA